MRPYEKPIKGIRKGVREFISDKTDIASISIGPADDIDIIDTAVAWRGCPQQYSKSTIQRGFPLLDRKMKGILRTNHNNVNLEKKFE